MQELIIKFTENMHLIAAYIILAYALSQARRVTNDVANNIDKFGSDNSSKRIASNKSIFNFYMVIAAIIIIVTASLKLISTELFVALLVAVLMGLGIKLTSDILEK